MIIIDKWAGLVTNASQYTIPPGAAVTQVNVQCLTPGQLNARSGVASMTFSTHTGTTSPIIAMRRCQMGSSEAIVYQNALGEIRVARGPA
jgi:hypothetical protein